MQKYKQEFIEFMVKSNVLRFGEFVTKSGRQTPFFINTGNYTTGEQLEKLVLLIQHLRTHIIETNAFEQAQICCGGVDTTEINPDTLESNYVPGIYFAGELLDVDGICGGYNLQWAWSSGFIAGKEAVGNASN